jgi:dienelactone hydrolase
MFFIFEYLLYFAGGGVALTAGLASYLAFFQPRFNFPQPTGKYAIGTTTYHWIDENKSNKELMVQLWYPSAENKNAQKPVAPYAPYFVEHLKKNQKLGWLLALSRPMYTYAAKDAQLVDGEQKLPVIIFSHGMGGFRNANTAQCEELASHGYVVVGLSHSYACQLIQFPDGRIKALDPVEFNKDFLKNPMDDFNKKERNIAIWVDDVQMVLDHFEKLTTDPVSSFCNRLDMEKIGMFGHSYGGNAAMHLCLQDARIKIGVDMDGALLGFDITKKIDKPFMFLLSGQLENMSNDLKKGFIKMGVKEEVAQEYVDACVKNLVPKIDALMDATGHNMYKITIQDTNHNAFSDMALIKEACLLSRPLQHLGAGPLNGYRATKIVNSYLVSFFDKYLKDMAASSLDSDQSKYPEVEMVVKR